MLNELRYTVYQWYSQLMGTEHVCAMTCQGERPSTAPPVCCCSPAPCLSVLTHANLLFLPASRTLTPLTLLTLSVNKNTAPNRLPSMPKLSFKGKQNNRRNTKRALLSFAMPCFTPLTDGRYASVLSSLAECKFSAPTTEAMRTCRGTVCFGLNAERICEKIPAVF